MRLNFLFSLVFFFVILMSVSGAADYGPITMREDANVTLNGGYIINFQNDPLLDPAQINNSLPFDKITFNNSPPAVTAHAIYSDSGDLMWDGGQISTTSTFIFNGTTDDELHGFIDTNGQGTYYINQALTIDSGLVLDQPYIKLVWPSGNSNSVNVTMSSGTAIDIQATHVTLDHPMIIFYNTASTANATRINGTWCELIRPKIYCKDGTGVVIESNGWFYEIVRPQIEMNVASATAKGFWGLGQLNGWITGGMAAQGKYGMFLERGFPMVFGTYFLNQSGVGIRFQPTADYSTGDAWFREVCVDYTNGYCVSSSGSYAVKNVNFEGCWFYQTSTIGNLMFLDNTEGWSIIDSPVMTSLGGGVYINDKTTDLMFSNNRVWTNKQWASGVTVVNDTENYGFLFTGNSIVSHADGYGIDVSGTLIDKWTVTSNYCSSGIGSSSTSGTKILANNR